MTKVLRRSPGIRRRNDVEVELVTLLLLAIAVAVVVGGFRRYYEERL